MKSIMVSVIRGLCLIINHTRVIAISIQTFAELLVTIFKIICI